MPKAWFAIPGALATPTGGYVYARRLIAALEDLDWHLEVVPLPSSYPFPSEADREATEAKLESLSNDRPLLVDGLAYGALDGGFLAACQQHWVALVHHPLALEAGLAHADKQRLRDSEHAALAEAREVIVTSPSTGRCLSADYGVPEAQITVALPGTDPGVRSRGNGAVPRLLTVATLTPRKGHDVLVAALARIVDLSWEALWVGSADRDTTTTARLRRAIREDGLETRIALAGSLDAEALSDCYRKADVFVLPSRHEGFGMAFAEALAHGLPVVGCAAGAVPETVPTDAGILVPTDDVMALADALAELLNEPRRRRQLADAAWRHGQQLPDWHETAARVAAALGRAMPS